MTCGMPGQLVRSHVNHGAMAVQLLMPELADQRFPGGRAPRAMPNPLTGAAGVLVSPAWASGVGLDASSSVDGGSGFASAFGSGAVGCAAGAAFLAPGRLAPAAMPRPLTGAAGALASGAADSDFASGCAAGADCVEAAVFLAPGRLAPPAMPSPLTGAAGALAFSVAGADGDCVSSAAFLAPGRLAPPAIPSPVTALAALSSAGAAAAVSAVSVSAVSFAGAIAVAADALGAAF